MYLVGIDPGAHAAVAFLIHNKLQVFDCRKEEELEHVFSLLYSRSVSENKEHTIIGIEDVHAIHGSGATNTFTFGRNLGFWVGILRYLKFNWKPIPIKSWQEMTMNKPARPDISKMSEIQIKKAKEVHRKAVKEESLRVAKKAFPKAKILTHDVADAVNMVRYLQYLHNKSSR